MGVYLNPGNQGFERIKRSGYVDKTGMIALINRTINTTSCLTCVSRPRRFGKSFAAQMLAAYYDRSCDSSALFQDLQISSDVTFSEHMNRYNVLYLDMTGVAEAAGKNEIVPYIVRNITEELNAAIPGVKTEEAFFGTLVNAAEADGHKFIMIIDEWDAPIREEEDPGKQREYLTFLRSLFKNSGTTSRIFAAAYMTGILPIKKDGSQSAISDFYEFTMLRPYKFSSYVGFTEEEVLELCRAEGISFTEMKRWYDGYEFKGTGPVYNPNSVMKALKFGEFDSYWTETSAADALMKYISEDYTGLQKTIAELIGGIAVPVNTNGFANDLTTFRSKDDVLTLLIHLGYLAYDTEKRTARIPNEEIRLEFSRSVREVKHEETLRRLKESDQLFFDAIHGNEDAVAARIEKIHLEETTPLHYNSEASLRSVIKLAFYTYKDYYLQWEELPAGSGFADIIYLPKPDSEWPALVVELKWNQSAEGAVEQILSRNYPDALKGYGGDIVLVGINYDKNAPAGERKHSCRIRKLHCDIPEASKKNRIGTAKGKFLCPEDAHIYDDEISGMFGGKE